MTDKINKNDYILLLGDLHVRNGNQKLGKITGTNGEPTINSSGNKLTDFCCFDEFRTMNSFFKHKNIQKFKWLARATKSVVDCAI